MAKPKKVAIIDYQLSNLFSVMHACTYVGLDATITFDKKVVASADAAILPGVGAFGDAMKNLDNTGLTETIQEFIAQGKPFMGVCLGLQLLFEESEEFGRHKGLGVLKGDVKKFPTVQDGKAIKVPQIGWNKIYSSDTGIAWSHSPLRHIKENSFMYFVHSYHVVPEDESVVLTKTNYDGVEYASGVLYNNVFAVQFHPEKSGEDGIAIYKNWAQQNGLL